jgi:hypothetical protein
MHCKYHPDRPTEVFCTSCNAPLCKECAEQSASGEYYCYECAMLHSLTEVGTSIRDRRDKGEQRKEKAQKRWGPFHYFLIVSVVLLAVMWGVILFGKKPAPATTSAEVASNDRVLLFMVDGAIKRYALYENNTYPSQLTELLPDYLSMREGEAAFLERLSYRPDPKVGYRLSLVKPGSGEMNLILTPTGIEYMAPATEGA